MREMSPRTDHYPLPNESEDTVYSFADWLEDEGLEPEESTVAFVGGTFYAGMFEDKYPEADVIAVEQSPWSAYCQSYAASELESGTEPEKVLRNLFLDSGDLETNESPLGPTHSESLYNEIIDSHLAFAERSNNFDTTFVRENLEFKPDEGLNYIPFEEEYDFDEPGHPASRYSSSEDLVESLGQSFMWADRGATTTVTGRIRDGFLRAVGKAPEEEYEEAAREIMEMGLERQVIDHDELERLKEDVNSRAEAAMEATLDKWQREAAENLLRSDGSYIYSAGDKNGDRRVFGPLTHTTLLNREILKTENITEPSNVIISDVRETDLDADVAHTNNVFDYLDRGEQDDAIESLCSGDELLLGHSSPGLTENWDSAEVKARDLEQAQKSSKL